MLYYSNIHAKYLQFIGHVSRFNVKKRNFVKNIVQSMMAHAHLRKIRVLFLPMNIYFSYF